MGCRRTIRHERKLTEENVRKADVDALRTTIATLQADALSFGLKTQAPGAPAEWEDWHVRLFTRLNVGAAQAGVGHASGERRKRAEASRQATQKPAEKPVTHRLRA